MNVIVQELAGLMTDENAFKDSFKDYLYKRFNDSSSWLDGFTWRLEDDKLTIIFSHKYLWQWFAMFRLANFEKSAREYFDNQSLCIRCQVQNAVRPLCLVDSPLQTRREEKTYGGAEKFFFNAKNEMTFKALMAMADEAKASGNRLRTLLVCGEGGVGKSHLLRLLNDKCATLNSERQIVMGRTSWFCKELARRQQESGQRDLWGYQSVLILDDFQEILGENEWQNLLANHIDDGSSHLFKKSATLIFIAALTGSAKDLRRFNSRLRSRLENDLVLELLPPDLDVRLKFLEEANRSQKMGLNREHLLFLARNSTSIPQLSGVLRKIKFYVSLYGKVPSASELERITKNVNAMRPLTWMEILAKVAKKLNLKPEDTLKKSRRPEYVFARQVSMYLCRLRLGISYPELGRLFGGKDHSTAMHSIKKVVALMESDKNVRKLVQELEHNLQ